MKRAGFTLIELSIVLVIIGLIIGGVLFGRSLIRGAEINAGISQIERYKAAISTFQLKYNCVPGDCANPATFGFTAPGGAGNGDGAIVDGGLAGYNGGNWGTNAIEGANLWLQLGQAKLIEQQLAGFTTPFTKLIDYAPALKFPDPAYVWAVTGTYNKGAQEFGNTMIISTNYPWGGTALTGRDAYMIDAKLDDGKPLTGMVRDVGNGYNQVMVASYTPYGCSNGGADTAYGCDLRTCFNDINAYDILGSNNGNIPFTTNDEVPYNPERIDCMIAFGKAW